MFTEYLNSARWRTIMPGMQMCQVSVKPQQPLRPAQLPVGCLELFFCRSGQLTLTRRSEPVLRIRKQEFLLLSDCSDLCSACTEAALDGVCIHVELDEAEQAFNAACGALQLNLQLEQVRSLMRHSMGCLTVSHTAWSRALLPILQCLPPEEQDHYCAIKTLELFYLLCTKNALLEHTASVSPGWGYLAHTVTAMHGYMETHLDEKLTISSMSSRFHISPTAFKSCFRTLYGQPVHSWLQQVRMEHASRMLLESAMTVLQIAQEVGYESVGQFNVSFKRQYGVTPSQYRKMSVSSKI